MLRDSLGIKRMMTSFPKDMSIWTRSDGSKAPLLDRKGLHYKAIVRAAEDPEMQTTHKAEIFEKLMLGGLTLSEQEVRELRHSAKFPGFVRSLQKALNEVADLHDTARALSKKSPAQLDHEIAATLGARLGTGLSSLRPRRRH